MSITFTSDVFGQTKLNGILRFGVSNNDNIFSTEPDKIQFSAGVSGHQIVLGMRNELQNTTTSSFNGNVSGNSLTVPDACEGLFEAPGEYQMSMDLEPCSDNPPPNPPPNLDLDLAVERRDEDLLGLTLKGKLTCATGRLRVEIRLDTQVLTSDVRFSPFIPVREVMQSLDKVLAHQCSSLRNSNYVGIVDDHLLLEVNIKQKSRVGITLSVDSGGVDPGFTVSGVYALALKSC